MQTGGDYSNYIGTELLVAKPTVTYPLKGYFTRLGSKSEFRLLRGQANADVSSLFVEKSRLALPVADSLTSQLNAKAARMAAVSNGVGHIDGVDCNAATGWAADRN